MYNQYSNKVFTPKTNTWEQIPGVSVNSREASYLRSVFGEDGFFRDEGVDAVVHLAFRRSPSADLEADLELETIVSLQVLHAF